MQRLDEENNTAKFAVVNFTGRFHLPPHVIPLSNDWSVTGRGAVIARLTWGGLDWTEETENVLLAFCNTVGEVFLECC